MVPPDDSSAKRDVDVDVDVDVFTTVEDGEKAHAGTDKDTADRTNKDRMKDMVVVMAALAVALIVVVIVVVTAADFGSDRIST